jgi:oligopeptide transport system ATP-binding protein
MSTSMNTSTNEPLLQVRELRVHLPTPRGRLTVVDGLSFEVARGECLGIVGESGSGKSQTALALMGLNADGAKLEGELLLNGENLLSATPARRRALRGPGMAMIFQDPMSSLNPYLSIGLQLAEVAELHQGLTRAAAMAEAERVLDAVGITAARLRLAQYPHELSGGMRQRVMIAMALLAKPRLLIADEPTTALDPTIQRQILWLLDTLRRELGMAMLFITHDLGLVSESCERVLVMYAGQAVEAGPTARVLRQPLHPYTGALLAARPGPSVVPGSRLAAIGGQPPDLHEPPRGCRFSERCRRVEPDCLDAPIAWRSGGARGLRCLHPLPAVGTRSAEHRITEPGD